MDTNQNYDYDHTFYGDPGSSTGGQTPPAAWQPRPEPTPMKGGRRHSGVWMVLLILVLLTAAVAATGYLLRSAGISVRKTDSGFSITVGRHEQTGEPTEEQVQQMPGRETTPAQPTQPAAPAQPTDRELPTLTIGQTPEGQPTRPSSAEGALSLQEIYRKMISSVVSISTVTRSGKASGTGIIMTASGYIITNHHVIADALAINVMTSDSQDYAATLIGSDETSDLAVLRIDAAGLSPAEFGDSSVLQVGDAVVAIGDPLGVQLRGTMTDGIVSAINRDLTVGDRTMTLIQTNAALNNGNSGGPLINCYGQVIGINTMKMGNYSTYSASVEGLGFAIPIDAAKPILDELIEKGYVSGRPSVGFEGETLPTTFRIYYRLPDGIYVTHVYEQSDAYAKGLQEGDIITEINGTAVGSVEELNRIKNQFSAGDSVTLTVYRGGTFYSVPVVLMDQAYAK